MKIACFIYTYLYADHIRSRGRHWHSACKRTPELYTDKIRLVSRTPEKVNPTDELFPADITDAAQVERAVAGSEVVYLVAGLEYKTSVWQEQWPRLMNNVIAASKKHKTKLVFFDNVYMYDPDHMHI